MKQALTGTDYNRRVAECAAAARMLLEAAGRPGAKPLLGCVTEHGARFSGAGFRGCCLGLVDRARAVEVAGQIAQAYAERQPGLASGAAVAVVDSDDGARFLGPGHPR